MSADDINNQQTRDGTAADDNIDKTPAANVTVVKADANTAAFEEVKKMFSNFKKKSAEQDKVMSSLTKQGKSSGQNTDETTSAQPRKTFLPSRKVKRMKKSNALIWILAVTLNLRTKTHMCIHDEQGAVRLEMIPSLTIL
ncbi:hypothetical protein DY000_02006744 [Brassica cretica]|uniref:Uncharacterized protein n=1 Tax=Brassica cretica TaxID=69181 RepID=A0ABQ7BW84_BRACR|nr:hypothetical protein DY000_02006744 [Brassica cretica]